MSFGNADDTRVVATFPCPVPVQAAKVPPILGDQNTVGGGSEHQLTLVVPATAAGTLCRQRIRNRCNNTVDPTRERVLVKVHTEQRV